MSGPHSETGKSKQFHERLPRWRPARISLGILLLIGGLLGFLPIIGFWMIPLGLAVLAVDIPPLRRLRRRLLVRYEKRRRKRAEGRAAGRDES